MALVWIFFDLEYLSLKQRLLKNFERVFLVMKTCCTKTSESSKTLQGKTRVEDRVIEKKGLSMVHTSDPGWSNG